MTFGTLSPVRARLAREDGFGIIEVLVSALVIALAAVGTFAALDSATATSGLNKARSVASSLAQADQERLRSMPPASIATLAPTTTKTVDSRVFTIASSAEWVADRSGTPSCSSADGKADYLKITSSVTWPGMGAIAPVEAESLRAVPKGAFRPNEGSIAVKVLDRNGTGVANIAVAITGPTNYSATTNALGCVIIDQVPIGTYTISINQSGYVEDKLPDLQAVTESTVVAKEQTSSTTLTYDRAGTASVQFRSTASVGGAVNNTVGEAFTVGHSGLGFPIFRSFSLPTLTAPAASMSSGPPHTLFPFATAYGIWAGACPEANPVLWGAAGQTALVPPAGSIGPVDVREPLLRLRVRRYTTSSQTSGSSSNVANGSRVVIKPVVAGCTRTIILSTTSGIVSTPLPYGDYSICAQVGSSAGTTTAQRVTVIRRNGVAAGTNYLTAYSASASPPTGAAVILPFTPVSGSCPG